MYQQLFQNCIVPYNFANFLVEKFEEKFEQLEENNENIECTGDETKLKN